MKAAGAAQDGPGIFFERTGISGQACQGLSNVAQLAEIENSRRQRIHAEVVLEDPWLLLPSLERRVLADKAQPPQVKEDDASISSAPSFLLHRQ